MIKYFNGYNKLNNPSYLTECVGMLHMLCVYCDTTRLLNFGRTSVVQREYDQVKLYPTGTFLKICLIHNSNCLGYQVQIFSIS